MKLIPIKILLFILTVTIISCEDRIYPTLKDANPTIVIDAWINNKPVEQVIQITESRPYFDNNLAVGVIGALVTITDNNGITYSFNDTGNGSYKWTPGVGESFGEIGNDYTLEVDYDGKLYQAFSSMNRVPVVDSISFRFEEKDFVFPDSYFAEFWSRDLVGSGDTYWIKTYKNGNYLNKPAEINIAFDAGFSEGGNIDGLIFIPPIRDAINPIDEDNNDNFLSPYSDGDSIYVEIHSIPKDAFLFLNEMALQIDRPGGFGELFATPLSNVPTNIIAPADEEALGFFTVSAVNGNGRKLDIREIPK
ncbi:MAG: DUF4249 domain-containing protein [Bacteroidetes bacterium]|nr:DUF4249 domain-containing protein [Bacteroidota bacterium]MDA1120455.1 DUF4249 domain-containing protein [Bacteroidota bacterium]